VVHQPEDPSPDQDSPTEGYRPFVTGLLDSHHRRDAVGRPESLGYQGAVRCRARCAAVRQAPLQYLAGRPLREPSPVNGLPHR